MAKLHFDDNIAVLPRPVDRLSAEDVQEKYEVSVVHRMAQNENPLGPSPKVIESIQAVAPTLSYYPTFSDFQLRSALANLVGRNITPDHFYTGCSGFESIELITRGFVHRGEECIVCTPTFTSAYKKVASIQGAKVVDVPLKPDDFAYDIEGILNVITDQTRVVFLCNPNNPTGNILTKAQMLHLMDSIPDHVLVVSDEVYHHFVQNDDYPDSLQYVQDGYNLIIIHSFSKAYGLAGLRLGYGITRPEIADYLSGMHRSFHQNKLALSAGVAAVEDQAYLQKIVSFLLNEKAWLYAQLDRLGILYWKSETNFVLLETPLPSGELHEALLAYGVMVRPQARAGLTHSIRVSVGTHSANVAFIDGLEAILSA